MSAPATPCLVGPTACGKSEVALACARATQGEVISCDAFAVYRGLRLLSAAPQAPPDVPHHLVGLLEAAQRTSAAEFVADADRLVAAVLARGRRPWIVGGTALYLRCWLKGMGTAAARDEALRARLAAESATQGPQALHARLAALDPARAAQLHPHDERRIVRALEIIASTGRPASALRQEWDAPDRVRARVVGLRRSPEDLDRRIAARSAQMVAQGVLEEARAFLAAGPSPEARKALGLDLLAGVLAGTHTLATAEQGLAQLTRRFARRQMTFFRGFDAIAWLDVPPDEPAATTAARVLRLLEEEAPPA
ncbi:MAG: tRNA (adenosine(37)-N6)-dimethylallyltransferase MiaA [Planctomycetia bacterium]